MARRRRVGSAWPAPAPPLSHPHPLAVSSPARSHPPGHQPAYRPPWSPAPWRRPPPQPAPTFDRPPPRPPCPVLWRRAPTRRAAPRWRLRWLRSVRARAGGEMWACALWVWASPTAGQAAEPWPTTLPGPGSWPSLSPPSTPPPPSAPPTNTSVSPGLPARRRRPARLQKGFAPQAEGQSPGGRLPGRAPGPQVSARQPGSPGSADATGRGGGRNCGRPSPSLPPLKKNKHIGTTTSRLGLGLWRPRASASWCTTRRAGGA